MQTESTSLELVDKMMPNQDSVRSTESDLILTHPNADEEELIARNQWEFWKEWLTLDLFLQEPERMGATPLACDGGLTTWILTDRDLPPGKRRVFSSCESYRKRAILSSSGGRLTDGIVHGIASVFTSVEYRRRGYARIMMEKLAERLETWQTNEFPCFGSVLYSDIGKEYYTRLGWQPRSTNFHIDFHPIMTESDIEAKDLSDDSISPLCESEELLLREHMAAATTEATSRILIVPDIKHIGWHRGKEEFACQHLFGEIPKIRGAIASSPQGAQVWAMWTRRYHSDPSEGLRNNELHILHLSVKPDPTATRLPSDADKIPSGDEYMTLLSNLKAVIHAAQRQAKIWKLDKVQLWDPSPLVEDMISKMGIEHVKVERENGSIASALWYSGAIVPGETPLWINNEHYAWC